ncbi:formylglycine-generating enzyme family protein [Candidatus Uabimicrobium amorphum]|uniref:Sulfatase-modifying factor enzyme-like domain-containing protein n=1 Tax=Uabimicrobium amorphum TaxID=2596890 RepID=A0A5S9IUR7_UABAM|nr:formylglycine-generating enzyme family protein [Candidatus Uabimicrobium amorphum]BBM86965.1 hypothetical protein UABAM_05367 [Candidatus Uabimicrobium amorphum]
MKKKIVKGKSLQRIQPHTKYMGCAFYLEDLCGDDLIGVEFDNCSFRGWLSDWGKDSYGLWMAFTYENVRHVFRWIESGTFWMGSPSDQAGRSGNERRHQVTLEHGFWLAETACTQQLWEAVMKSNPSKFLGENCPVDSVTWNNCVNFIDTLNAKIPQLNLCLPSEAQWEYACRAGTTTRFSFGDEVTTKQVNYGRMRYDSNEEYNGKTIDVKELPCNAWGLYQMHGNVLEWCNDWYGNYSDKAQINPTGPEKGTCKVSRGGSWYNNMEASRCAYRHDLEPNVTGSAIGFRLSRRYP